MKRYLFAVCLALTPGCWQATEHEPKGAAEAERDAYEVAIDSNDTSSIALDIATIALHAVVEMQADKKAATCKGAGRDLAECQAREKDEAVASGQPIADEIDRAHKIQLELRDFLLDYRKCAPGTVDRLCQANAIAKATRKSPEVKKAVTEARRKLRNVRPAK